MRRTNVNRMTAFNYKFFCTIANDLGNFFFSINLGVLPHQFLILCFQNIKISKYIWLNECYWISNSARYYILEFHRAIYGLFQFSGRIHKKYRVRIKMIVSGAIGINLKFKKSYIKRDVNGFKWRDNSCIRQVHSLSRLHCKSVYR